ncbi:unnamed protein product [Pleuronectes platessa]|uniref:Uncharacterized protein n=1 Tax=Pleuronectes platessa TaxID=8262 RepID=A0A9N7YTW9_PLEPL|nr:unnamed protein product [Pleuronectes platessa]
MSARHLLQRAAYLHDKRVVFTHCEYKLMPPVDPAPERVRAHSPGTTPGDIPRVVQPGWAGLDPCKEPGSRQRRSVGRGQGCGHMSPPSLNHPIPPPTPFQGPVGPSVAAGPEELV